MDPAFGIKFFGALFAIMNPMMVLPIFLSLTTGMPLAEQRRAALAVTAYSAILCAVVALAGLQILGFFGITVNDFRVAGGLVLVGIAFGMLNGSGVPAHEGSDDEKASHASAEDVAFYPMAFPMVVGPGTITTLVVFSHEVSDMDDRLVYGAVVLAMLALLGVALFFAGAIGARLSTTLRTILSRLMGMILLAIAVSMVIAGVKDLLPGLAG